MKEQKRVIKANVEDAQKLDEMFQNLQDLQKIYDKLSKELKKSKEDILKFLKEKNLLATDMSSVQGEKLICKVIYKEQSTEFSDEIMLTKAPETYKQLLELYKKECIDLKTLKIKAPSTYDEVKEKYYKVSRKECYAINGVEEVI